MIILEANLLKKSIGDRDLFSVEQLKVDQLDRIGIVGRNGIGKTTLINILAGRLKPDQGTVTTSATIGLIPQIKPDFHDKSGGEVTFQYIEEALSLEPDILFADEPTMYLDIEHMAMLEEKIISFKGALVVISHDRTFLDRICNKIWEIENQQITVYKGNYSDYAKRKQVEKRQQQAQYEEYIAKKKQLEQAVRLKKQKAAKMIKPPKRMSSSESKIWKAQNATKQKGVHQSIKAIETRIEQMKEPKKPRGLPSVKIDIPNADIIKSRWVIRADRAEAKISDRTLWSDASFQIRSGEKVVILGPNGSGKTTLIRKLISRDEGIHIGSGVKLGYFSQNLDILQPDETVLDNVKASAIHDEQIIRTVLARLLFQNEDVFKKVSVLSGGERVKVAFAKVFLSDMNVLIMDEPTNFLDIESIEALEHLLVSYKGTLLFASHDVRFVEKIATKILEIRDQRIVVFDGTYSEYKERRQEGSGTSHNVEAELLKVETRITEVISKLAKLDYAEQMSMLEAEFKSLIEERNRLKNLLG